uniref:Uncharacterized protein n=1 Tax=Cacopsylla melanoneura TaxID=428564 RepID=A0A8D8Y8G7_9HEMI
MLRKILSNTQTNKNKKFRKKIPRFPHRREKNPTPVAPISPECFSAFLQGVHFVQFLFRKMRPKRKINLFTNMRRRGGDADVAMFQLSLQWFHAKYCKKVISQPISLETFLI